MRLEVISTGSAGNLYLLEGDTEALLLDAGLRMNKNFQQIKDFRKIVGCLITHEHKDHCKGARDIAMRGIRTYASAGTIKAMSDETNEGMFHAVQPMKPFKVGSFSVIGFPTQHDAEEPFGYLIRNEQTKETAVYATDTYYLRYTFPGVYYWIVECNYCEDVMNKQQENGEISKALRGRLLESHMSLRRLKDALAANDLSKTRSIVLVHLSDGRSDEERMVSEIQQATNIETVAARNGMTIDLDMLPF